MDVLGRTWWWVCVLGWLLLRWHPATVASARVAATVKGAAVEAVSSLRRE